MIKYLMSLVGLGGKENRRKYERYPIVTALEVMIDGQNFRCEAENVSAGGLRLTPALSVKAGETITILHPRSGMSLEATVAGSDPSGTRARFNTDDAGTVVSVWVRMTQEDA